MGLPPYTSVTERLAAFPGWLHTYNHPRGHTALGGKSPAERVSQPLWAEHLAHGFRNFTHYRIRILLAADGTRA